MADLDLSTLKAYTPLFPMLIKKYEQFVPDQNASVLDKINSIIAELNAIGQLSNNVVKDWNTVYQWCMNDGLQTDVNNKLEDMRTNGEISDILNNIFDNLTGDMTTLHTTAKDKLVNSINEVDDLAKLNQTNIGDLTTLTTTDKENLVAAINNNVASLADKMSQSEMNLITYYLPSSYKGTDISTALQTALNDATIGKVYVMAGDYNLSTHVTIPAGKQLILAGDNGSNHITNAEASNTVFAKINPTFDNDYCFYMSDRSSIIGGFINCEGMTNGGGIKVDFSQTGIGRLNIKTLLSGGNKWNLNAIFLNGDRPSGTLPGYLFFLKIDCGIIGFGTGVYLKRTDTYTVNDGSVNGLTWCVGIYIEGHMSTCQRYVYYNTYSNLFAGNSSWIRPVLQSGVVPDPNIPAVEVSGDDQYLGCQFHDIGSTATNQKVRYKLRNTSNAIVVKGYKGGSDIQDSTATNTSYVQNGQATPISTLNDSSTIQDGWYEVSGGKCTINMRIPSLPVYASWTTIYTLPFTAKYTTRRMFVTDDGMWVTFMITGNTLQAINTNASAKTVNMQMAYPLN